ncbi:hypothetical protein BH09DEP1_BH09DEP1_2830 [soil metagenome]
MKFARWCCLIVVINFGNFICAMSNPDGQSPQQIQRPRISLAEFLSTFCDTLDLPTLKPCSSAAQPTVQDDILEDSILLRQLNS